MKNHIMKHLVYYICAFVVAVLFLVYNFVFAATNEPAPTLSWKLGTFTTVVGGTVATTTDSIIFKEDLSTSTHRVEQSLNVPPAKRWEYSVDLRSVGGRNVRVYLADSNNSASFSNIIVGLSGSGTIVSKSSGANSSSTFSITNSGNGWYKLKMNTDLYKDLDSASTPIPVSKLKIQMYIATATAVTYNGDNTSGFEFKNPTLLNNVAGNLPIADANIDTYGIKTLMSKREGYGANTTGGLGGEIYTVTNTNDSGWGSLRFIAEDTSDKPYWITFAPGLSGSTINLSSQIYLRPNRTIDGAKPVGFTGTWTPPALSGYGINISGLSSIFAKNIILNNFTIKNILGTENDAISIYGGNKVTDIWIHKMTLSGMGGDGLLDITEGASAITIDNTKFLDHDKVMLLNAYPTSPDPNNPNGEILNADSLKYASRDAKTTVTMHHNYFEGNVQRMPRAIFGKLHMYNNVFKGWTGYAVGSSFRQQTLLEGNVFSDTGPNANKAVVNKVGIDPEVGLVNAKSNLFLGNATNTIANSSTVFTAAYAFGCEVASTSLITTLFANAGAQDSDLSANIPKVSSCPVLPTQPTITTTTNWSDISSSLKAWSLQNTSATANTPTAVSFKETAVTGSFSVTSYIDVPASDYFQFSFNASPAGARDARIYLMDQNNQSANFVAATCNLGGTTQNTSWAGSLSTDAKFTNTLVSTGVYNCKLSGKINSNKTNKLRLIVYSEKSSANSFAGDINAGLNLSNIKLETGIISTSTTATTTTSTTTTATTTTPVATTTATTTTTVATPTAPVVWNAVNMANSWAGLNGTFTNTAGVMTLTENSSSTIGQINNYFSVPGAKIFRLTFSASSNSGRNIRVYVMEQNSQANYFAGICKLSSPAGFVTKWIGGAGILGTYTATLNSDNTYKCQLDGTVNNLTAVDKLRINITAEKTANETVMTNPQIQVKNIILESR